ncbi:hypothetical protein [Xanthomonas hortorum]|uniref:hypothetical protein n=1 Tax=Xanthomonas hortorum TaxID=56454 RepID=UPI0032E85950
MPDQAKRLINVIKKGRHRRPFLLGQRSGRHTTSRIVALARSVPCDSGEPIRCDSSLPFAHTGNR